MFRSLREACQAAESGERQAHALATLLAGASSTHLMAPRFFDAMILPLLPGRPRAWTYGSAAAELGVAALVAYPATRWSGGLLAAALFVALLPGNVQLALQARRRRCPAIEQLGSVLRLPLVAGTPGVVGAASAPPRHLT